jgi:hypothetical protein
MGEIALPKDSQRIAIMGRTGTGKTVAGVYHLSERDFTAMPWIMLNFKEDELLNAIPHAIDITLADGVPKKKGLYNLHLESGDGDRGGPLEPFLMQVKQRGRMGIYADEGFEIDRLSKAYRGIQTQGRSLKIPTITLTQRPTWMSRFIISEADFYQVFALNDRRDQDTVSEFTPHSMKGIQFPEYHSYYYQVAKNQAVMLPPVPSPDTLLEKLETKLKPFRKIREI